MATTAITLGGLGIVLDAAWGFMRPLSPGVIGTGNPTPVAITTIVFGSAVIFAVVALLSRIFGALLLPRHTPQSEQVKTLPSAPVAVQLPASHLAGGSVTEHTTRNFERAYKELAASE
jgi:hypothetical protein